MKILFMASIVTAIIIGQTAQAGEKQPPKQPEKIHSTVNGKSWQGAYEDFKAAWRKWKEAE